jgi:hypothetical protein
MSACVATSSGGIGGSVFASGNGGRKRPHKDGGGGGGGKKPPADKAGPPPSKKDKRKRKRRRVSYYITIQGRHTVRRIIYNINPAMHLFDLKMEWARDINVHPDEIILTLEDRILPEHKSPRQLRLPSGTNLESMRIYEEPTVRAQLVG